AGFLNVTTRLFSLSLLHFEPLHRARLGHRLWFAGLRSGLFLGRPFCEFGPAVSDIELGVLARHFDRAIETDIDVPAREGLYGAEAWRRLQANPKRSGFSGFRRRSTCRIVSMKLDTGQGRLNQSRTCAVESA